jgi:hypothetical protein
MKCNLKLTHNNISLRLGWVKIKKCVFVCVCVVFSHKLQYMLLGTVFVFLFCVCPVLGGASRLYL